MFRQPKILCAVCLAAAVLLLLPANANAGHLWDCMFGNAPPPVTTYSPVFVPNCAPCYTPCATSCSPCAPQTCQYLPAVTYKPVYRSVSYGASTVTTYRPFLGTYQTRLVPYTTYRPLYVPTVYYQSCQSPCYSCPSYCSPCGGCDSSIGCTIGSGCSSCAPASQAAPPAQPKTFQQETNKPADNSNLQPTPQPEATLNSTPAPVLLNPNDRRASRSPIRQAARMQPASYAPPAPEDRNDGGWYQVEE